jgi:hypothetical protein
MEETEIHLSAIPSETQFISLVETLIVTYRLNIRMRSTLSTYPGSIHWHLNKSGERGTLEITFWPAGKRAWFSVQSRRQADWIEKILSQFKAELESDLSRPSPGQRLRLNED